MPIEITILISVVVAGTTVATFFLGRLSNAKNQGKEEGKRDGQMLQIMSELGYLKSNTDEIKRRLDKQDERVNSHESRITFLEASTKSAHKRMDDAGIGRVQ